MTDKRPHETHSEDAVHDDAPPTPAVEPPADDVLNPHAYGLPGEGGDTWAPQFDKFGPTLDVPGVRIDWNPKQGKRLRRKTAEF